MIDVRKVGDDWFLYTRERVIGPFATEREALRAQRDEARWSTLTLS